jgi:putative sigma-54 modulation protein
MEIKVAGRHAKVSEKTRNAAETGLQRIAKVVGKSSSANVTLTKENARQSAGVTIAAKRHTIVAKADGFDQDRVLRAAVQKAETQAQRYRTRQRTRKRKPVSE